MGRRLFHYTIRDHWEQIQRDRVINLGHHEDRYRDRGIRPAAWFSFNPEWEPTANRKIGTEGRRATFEEMEPLGLIRIEVKPETVPYTWKDYKELSGMPSRAAKQIQKIDGNTVYDWRVSFEPVPATQWIGVEAWNRDGRVWGAI